MDLDFASPGLKDHPSLHSRPSVKGVSRNVFLVSHNSLEESFGSKSKVNVIEAYFLLRLARHLARAGNPAQRMTLLTAYTGQMLYMMKVC